eukprot:6175162-Pleurochrysis_carterae.AAC.1
MTDSLALCPSASLPHSRTCSLSHSLTRSPTRVSVSIAHPALSTICSPSLKVCAAIVSKFPFSLLQPC